MAIRRRETAVSPNKACTRKEAKRPNHDDLSLALRRLWETFGHYGPFCQGELEAIKGLKKRNEASRPPRPDYLLDADEAVAIATAAYLEARDAWGDALFAVDGRGSKPEVMYINPRPRTEDDDAKRRRLHRALDKAKRRHDKADEALRQARGQRTHASQRWETELRFEAHTAAGADTL